MLPSSDIVGQTSTSLLWQFQVWWPNECCSWSLSWIPPFNWLMSLIAVSSLLDISKQILFWEVKHDWTPQWGEGEQLWSDWKGFAGQENHLLLFSETTASTDQKVALQLWLCHRGDSYHFSVCALAPPQSHTSSSQEVLCIPKRAKLNHHRRISTQAKLVHMLKIYTGWQKVKWGGFKMNHVRGFGITVLSPVLWMIVPDVKGSGAQRYHRWISINK